VIGMTVAIAPIGIASLIIGGLGGLGSYVIYRFVEETLEK